MRRSRQSPGLNPLERERAARPRVNGVDVHLRGGLSQSLERGAGLSAESRGDMAQKFKKSLNPLEQGAGAGLSAPSWPRRSGWGWRSQSLERGAGPSEPASRQVDLLGLNEFGQNVSIPWSGERASQQTPRPRRRSS